MMDLLSREYAVDSDDDDGGGGCQAPPFSKRLRSEVFHHPRQSTATSYPTADGLRHRLPSPTFGNIDVPSAGVVPPSSRYVSKRERAEMLASSGASFPAGLPATVITPPVVGSIDGSDLPPYDLSSLKHGPHSYSKKSKAYGELPIALVGHSKPVLSIQWSLKHTHLLASAGMDGTVRVWNVWRKGRNLVRVFSCHNAPVKDVRWSPEGLCLLSCGYDSSLRLVDVEKGLEKHQFKDDQVVDVVKFHPKDCNLFLSGGSKGFLKLWDLRTEKPVKEYLKGGLGPIQDVEFNNDGRHFVCSSDTSKTRITENAIIVWDVSRQVPLSNQVYTEAYTCTCVRYHPSDTCVVAQSNGNYAAIFSARPPFKLDKYRRFEGHGVWGFPVKCSFRSDGRELASGSSDGSMYFYDYATSRLLRKIKAFEQPCIDVTFHPSMPNVVASCSWAGEISVFERKAVS